jgi:hypothetical protein
MLHGLITESDLPEIEKAFPGIWTFYQELEEKPGTFLELVWRFGDAPPVEPSPAPRATLS